MIELIPGEWRYRDAETKQICPWYTKPVVEMLYKMDLIGKRVFEFGVGDSTLWFRSRGAETFGVDINIEWAKKVGGHVLWTEDEFIYQRAQYGLGKFDIIIIDGHFRDTCLLFCMASLNKNGIVIIDNYLQADEDTKWEFTPKMIGDFERLGVYRFQLYKEPEHDTWQTAILYT